MTLQEWIGLELNIHRSMIVGRETRLVGEDVFIIGMQTSYDEQSSYVEWGCDEEDTQGEPQEEPQEEQHEITTKLLLLYEYHDDSPDIVEDDDEYEEMTIRESLMADVEQSQNHTPGIPNITAFYVSGKKYHVSGISNIPLAEIDSHKAFWLLQEAFASKAIPKRWLDTDINDVWCAACDVEDSIYEVDWFEDKPDITVDLEEETLQRFVGARFTLGCGELDEPYKITVSDDPSGEFEVQLYGMSVIHEDTFDAGAILVIEYSAPEHLQMEFYRTEYLDGYCPEDGSGTPGFLFSDDEGSGHRFAFAGCVDEDFNGQVELELFSYYMHDNEAIWKE